MSLSGRVNAAAQTAVADQVLDAWETTNLPNRAQHGHDALKTNPGQLDEESQLTEPFVLNTQPSDCLRCSPRPVNLLTAKLNVATAVPSRRYFMSAFCPALPTSVIC